MAMKDLGDYPKRDMEAGKEIAARGQEAQAAGGFKQVGNQIVDTGSPSDTMRSGMEDYSKKISKEMKVPHLDKGTPFVHKAGLAVLHHGERVMPKDENKMYSLASHSLSGGSDSEATPEKEIKEIHIRKTKTKGSHVMVHHHTNPMAHPSEEHVAHGMDDMHKHLEAHLGEENPGEAEADAGQSGIPGEPQGAQAAQVAPPEGAQG